MGHLGVWSVNLVVEGDTDVPVARKIIEHVGLTVGDIHDKGGKAGIDGRLRGYLAAARHAPWLVLRDLDRDAPCAPALLRRLSVPSDGLACVRIPVRAIEAWVLADSERVASFLGVRRNLVPAKPDTLIDPKRSLVDLAQQSSKRTVKKGMVPRPGSGRRIGPLYEQLLIELGIEHWRPEVARKASPSLDRCIKALQRAKRSTWKAWATSTP